MYVRVQFKPRGKSLAENDYDLYIDIQGVLHENPEEKCSYLCVYKYYVNVYLHVVTVVT